MASKDLRDRLVDTFKRVDVMFADGTTPEELADIIMRAFQDYALKLIGEDDTDEYDKTPYGNGWQDGRKALRQQQRRTLGRKGEYFQGKITDIKIDKQVRGKP